jgi:NH3-dependent NAD+ synthetase
MDCIETGLDWTFTKYDDSMSEVDLIMIIDVGKVIVWALNRIELVCLSVQHFKQWNHE